MSKPEISYIMFELLKVGLPKNYPRWVLEVYIELNDSVLAAHLINSRNIYCISSLGIIDSLSPRASCVHEFTEYGPGTGTNIMTPPAYIKYLGNRYYGNYQWVDCVNIDSLRFSNLSAQENIKLVEDVRKAITEFYL